MMRPYRLFRQTRIANATCSCYQRQSRPRSGIRRAIPADGWYVYAACRHLDSADKLQSLARDQKGRIDILAMDVTNAPSIARAAANIQDGAIDVLFNSAGINGKPGQTTGNVDYISWAQVLDVNRMGPLRVTEALVDHIARSKRKLVVTITSGMGSLADNTWGGSIA